MEHPSFTNRLIHETSPYLLEHAHNPVDWYPWGEEAFLKAKEEDKPIFLSIGYATCHWCHVMGKEAFSDVEVAKLLNKVFVCIKVDREELPDVDNLYMEFASSFVMGNLGWPLNVVLTPELKPFYAATYLPMKEEKGGISIQSMIHQIEKIWNGDEKELALEEAEHLVDIFAETKPEPQEALFHLDFIHDSMELLFQMADSIYGGMTGAPKFPLSHQINFLFSYAATSLDSRANFFAEKTLENMAKGGIYDQLKGGFSRYVIDPMWIIPHFEKMLYDNAFLVEAYLDAWTILKKDYLLEVAKETLKFLSDDLYKEGGGFFSAIDSDSNGREGNYYLWKASEIETILGEEASFFCEFFDVTERGNFEGKNILHATYSLEEFVKIRGKSEEEWKKLFHSQKKQLLEVREKREKPKRDEKIITAWNAFAAQAFLKGYKVTREEKYLKIGLDTLHFILNHLFQEECLYRCFCKDEVKYKANLSDYAACVRSFLTAFEVTSDIFWFYQAEKFLGILETDFKNEEGSYYETDGTDPFLILRRERYTDGAEPSGNALQCENLLRWYQLTLEEKYLKFAEDIFKASADYLEDYPPAYTYHLSNLNRYYDKKSPLFVLMLNEKEENKEEILSLIYKNFIPYSTLIVIPFKNNLIQDVVEVCLGKNLFQNKTTLYICQNGICEAPLTEVSLIEKKILSERSLI